MDQKVETRPTTSRRSAATSRSCRARSTASRWSISTTAPRRRSRRRCSTRSSMPMRSEYANVHRGLHFLSNAATDAYEKARETVRRFLNAAEHRRDRLHLQHDRGDQHGRLRLRHAEHRRGRRDRALDHGAPLQHRAVAFHPRAAGRQAGLGAGRRSRRVPHRGIREAPDRAHQAGRHHADVERAGHGHADQGDRAASPMRAAFRCWSTAARRGAHAGRRAGSRLRLLSSSPATRSTARRGIGVLYGKQRACWSACGPSRAAAR